MNIGIYGYGNLGRGVECAVQQNPDVTLVGVFTRRDPAQVKTLTGAPVYPAAEIGQYVGKIDVLIICGGSATDLPEATPRLAKLFNVVDSFDTHARIPEHFANVNAAAAESGHTALISGGWDPGLFSLNRLYASAILPEGKDYTFWGRGVSQGPSDATRRVPGVLDARQYTIPVPEALEKVRSGQQPELTTRQKHRRECYVVAEEGADKAAIEHAIKTMPNYYDEYDTTVIFITKIETLQAENATLKDALANERASFDVYMATVQKERKLRSEERKLLEESISQKMAALRRQRYIPSLIFGGGVGTDGNGAQAFIGLGWKVGF